MAGGIEGREPFVAAAGERMPTRKPSQKKNNGSPMHPWTAQIFRTNSALTRAMESIKGFPSIPVLDGFSDVTVMLAECVAHIRVLRRRLAVIQSVVEEHFEKRNRVRNIDNPMSDD